jgi:hypothetical protein
MMKVDEILMVVIGLLSLIIFYKIYKGSLIEGRVNARKSKAEISSLNYTKKKFKTIVDSIYASLDEISLHCDHYKSDTLYESIRLGLLPSLEDIDDKLIKLNQYNFKNVCV